MNNTQILILLMVLVALCLAATVVGVRRARKKRPRSARRAELRQDLRRKVLYDEAKIDRLIAFERDELKRKGQREEAVEDLMERAIGRWERDNAGTASLY
jgi:predicted Holliday junction resolvase-like endonuclease